MQTIDIENLRSILRDYYGRHLKSKSDLSQNACCTGETQKRYKHILDLLPADVKERHYGCGCPVPQDDLTGLTVLDLGSGAGVDAFILSSLVGADGFVYGIDMTDEQLNAANHAIPFVMDRFHYDKPNIRFNKDFIEVAESIPDESIDLVISDCVINLSPRKDLVFKTIHRVLKDGGEFYVSDIATDRRVPEKIRNNPELIAECLGGSEYEHDWFDMMKDHGFLDPRTVGKIEVQRDVLNEAIVFYSMTVRGFKFSEPLDRRCEDYGQVAVYRGTMHDCPARYALDDHHVFEAQRPMPVCRNTARMLSETRLSRHFEVSAPIRHFGLLACGTLAGTTGEMKNSCC
jgi:arsenite methyltransferase